MKNRFMIALLVIGSNAFAAQKAYQLQMSVSVDGKVVASPKVTAKEGARAGLTQKVNGEQLFIEIISAEGLLKGRKGILMKFNVGLFSKEGTRTVLTDTQMLVKEGEPAVLSIHKKDSPKEDFKLSVTAKRMTQ